MINDIRIKGQGTNASYIIYSNFVKYAKCNIPE